jgi:hypothetical protein
MGSATFVAMFLGVGSAIRRSQRIEMMRTIYGGLLGPQGFVVLVDDVALVVDRGTSNKHRKNSGAPAARPAGHGATSLEFLNAGGRPRLAHLDVARGKRPCHRCPTGRSRAPGLANCSPHNADTLDNDLYLVGTVTLIEKSNDAVGFGAVAIGTSLGGSHFRRPCRGR